MTSFADSQSTLDAEILLVDDNTSDIELTLHVLQSNHPSTAIHVAEDGEDALNFLFCRGAYRDRTPSDRLHVILLDLKLPKAGGLEVLARLRADERTRAIPVVILTSSREPSDILNGYRLGVSAYIQKPVDFSEFRRKIAAIGLFWLVLNELPPRT